jgi:hypothetical protein
MTARRDALSTEELRSQAHRLSNLIAIIHSYNDLLLESELSPDQEEMFNETRKAARSALDICRAIEMELQAPGGPSRSGSGATGEDARDPIEEHRP